MDDELERFDRHIAEGKAKGICFAYHEDHSGEEVIEQALWTGCDTPSSTTRAPTRDETCAFVAGDDDASLSTRTAASTTAAGAP
jgi:uncharacterized cupin superfamily protein